MARQSDTNEQLNQIAQINAQLVEALNALVSQVKDMGQRVSALEEGQMERRIEGEYDKSGAFERTRDEVAERLKTEPLVNVHHTGAPRYVAFQGVGVYVMDGWNQLPETLARIYEQGQAREEEARIKQQLLSRDGLSVEEVNRILKTRVV